ncbi:MAG TPA: hypothetical protein ENN61_04955 [Bacteroidaceae bacterium]|nr:hypothetical protein [Bacteroidaceae bacterium]
MPPEFKESQIKIPGYFAGKIVRVCRFGGMVLAFLLISATGCNFISKSKKNSEEPVVRVNDRYLYRSDFRKVTEGLSKQDSIIVAKRYIDTWIREELMLYRAELALSDEQKNFENQIEEYRKSLLIYSYRQKLLQQKLDTVVQFEEIADYYENNMNNFLLSEDVIQGTYVKVPLSAPNLYQVRRWSRNNGVDDLSELEKYCINHAEKYIDFNNEWIYFNAIKDQIPLQIRQPSTYLKYNRNIETRDSLFIYFSHIANHKTEGDVAPLEMVYDDIRSILLNKRKIEFFQDLEMRVFNDGVIKNQFEIY